MFKRRNPIDEGGGDPPKEDASPLDNEFTVSSRHPMRPAGADGVEISRVGAFKPTPAAMRPGSETVRRVVDMPNPTRKGESTAMPAESKKLIVGRDISLNGKIASCDRLIVEGKVEAELQDCHTIEIAESGTFKGAAEIENAEVSGRYDGSLTVRDGLIVRSTGHVSGTIRYGRIEIERGGEINGDVKSLGAKSEKPAHREVPAAASPIGASAGIGVESRSLGKG
ncbi:MAG TPA: polymer-forming cytoskeletal protein [Alphaproteobacteria bacterium]|nr:polymer-forming cytoskeletal protein [Alphaproteobacteria bacterium]